ncbi:2OG-Fe dioxygenase family protein [Cognatilysobacter lacus]|uniref:2OG-Fe dioxygenase family protein n=1 Tax=Cognatilysobacter lacus TaxID=1643323 RepID=A0A5D8YVF6_9GAMM|nr:2OG-Fe dioxygenase family protein [Lysobacter lacus]TZF86618.1 2OG-Fe dioxygenase family protein [Lysobacter lacus]
MVVRFPPPVVAPGRVADRLGQRGYAVVAAEGVATLCGSNLDELAALEPSWDALVRDAYLRDGGRYRRRRHACFVVDGDAITQAPQRAHWQPLDYNALHGGMHRWFEPVTPEVIGLPGFSALLRGLGRLFSSVRAAPRWFVEAHQFRIDTADGVGRPTPEGAHRDGVDFVAVLLVSRVGVKGGETRVFEADGPAGERFTLEQPWSALLLDDTRVIHESTPIQPIDAASVGHRDTLVLTYREGAFQGDDP